MSRSVWQEFFDSYAPQYMREPFTRDTVREVGFLVELLELPAGASVLDVGCGTGRHSVGLAGEGYRVTGLDLSSGMLAEARAAALDAGVDVELLLGDATSFDLGRTYDAAVCLCEGGFTLVGADDPVGHDLAILRNVYGALVPGGRFVLTASNAMRRLRAVTPAEIAEGRFDPMTMTDTYDMEWDAPDGGRSLTVRERSYVPTELSLLCRHAGFEVEHVWGGTAGEWGRRPVQLDEHEIMVVTRRPAEAIDG